MPVSNIVNSSSSSYEDLMGLPDAFTAQDWGKPDLKRLSQGLPDAFTAQDGANRAPPIT